MSIITHHNPIVFRIGSPEESAIPKTPPINREQLSLELSNYAIAYRISECEESAKPEIPRLVAESIITISKALSKKENFNRYPFKDEMISDAVYACLLYVHNYNAQKFNGAAVSYIACICRNAFIHRIKMEKRESQAVRQSMSHAIKGPCRIAPPKVIKISDITYQMERLSVKRKKSPLDEQQRLATLKILAVTKIEAIKKEMKVITFEKGIFEKENTTKRRTIMRKLNAKKELSDLVQSYLDLAVLNGRLSVSSVGNGAAKTNLYTLTETGRKHIESILKEELRLKRDLEETEKQLIEYTEQYNLLTKEHGNGFGITSDDDLYIDLDYATDETTDFEEVEIYE